MVGRANCLCALFDRAPCVSDFFRRPILLSQNCTPGALCQSECCNPTSRRGTLGQPDDTMGLDPYYVRPHKQMPDNLVYMFGKLSKAVEVLVTNHGDIRNRVWVAAEYIFLVQPEGLPEHLRPDVEWIHKRLTKYPPNAVHKSALAATYQRTRSVTAGKIAARVWTLYHLMQSEIASRRGNTS